MDAFIEWQGAWVGWVGFVWIGYAFVLSLVLSAIVLLPERRALRRAEGEHWTELALRRLELQIAATSVLGILVITTWVVVTAVRPLSGIVSPEALAGLVLLAAMCGSVVPAIRVVPTWSRVGNTLIQMYVTLPGLTLASPLLLAGRLLGHLEVLVVVAGAAAAVVERVPAVKVLAFLGVAQRMPVRDSIAGGFAYWRVATRGLFVSRNRKLRTILVGDGTYDVLSASQLRTLLAPPPLHAPLPPGSPSILPALGCTALLVWFEDRHPWLMALPLIALGIYVWRFLASARMVAARWDAREPGDLELQAKTLERLYEATLVPSIRMLGIASLRDRLEVMGHPPAWPEPKRRDFPWLRVPTVAIVALFSLALFPLVLSHEVPPARTLGVGVALGGVGAPLLINRAWSLEDDDPHRSLLLELAFHKRGSDGHDAAIVDAYAGVGDCIGAELIAIRSRGRTRTRPANQAAVDEALEVCATPDG